MTLVHAALKKVKLFSNDLQTTIKDLCCDSASEQRYSRKCLTCQTKIIQFDIDESTAAFPEDDLIYDYWEKI